MTFSLQTPSLLSLLFSTPPAQPAARGRVIRFDTTHSPTDGRNLTADAARKRITHYLQQELTPCTMEELMLAVGLKRTQMRQHLLFLMQTGIVQKNKRSGYPTEYELLSYLHEHAEA